MTLPPDLTQIREPSSEENQLSPLDWVEIVSVIWSSRKFISFVTGIATIGAVIVALLLPEYYKSTATLLPETEKSKLAALGGLSDLASLAGVSVGGDGALAKLYPTILNSESVLRNVLYAKYQTKKFKEEVNLIEYWEIDETTSEVGYELALNSLREQLDISIDNKTNVVTISIETREPQLSADIVNKVIQQLDEFIRTKRTSSASEQRKWIEERLIQVKGDLEKSENKLKEFREKNRRVGDSPLLLLEQGRLMREVEINSTLYEELKKQHEIAKIEEIKNIPVINVMDSGRAPAKKERPKRTRIVLTTLLVSVLGLAGYAVIRHHYGDFLKIAVNRIK